MVPILSFGKTMVPKAEKLSHSVTRDCLLQGYQRQSYGSIVGKIMVTVPDVLWVDDADTTTLLSSRARNTALSRTLSNLFAVKLLISSTIVPTRLNFAHLLMAIDRFASRNAD